MSAGDGKSDTVGSLLASIAKSLNDSLRIFLIADKTHWGADEWEQFRVLEEALDEAKKDFQELGQLVGAQFYYEQDRTRQSLEELRSLRTKFECHAQYFKDWARQGGYINPIWVRETNRLRQELHRAQCHAAQRIFAAEKDGNRCLGAFQVYRQQRRNEEERRLRQKRHDLPPWQQQQQIGVDDRTETTRQQQQQKNGDRDGDIRRLSKRRRLSLEDLVPICNAIGKFGRFDRHDVAFVCDFCDGYIIWPDLQSMPSSRESPNSDSTDDDATTIIETPIAATEETTSAYPRWQARGLRSKNSNSSSMSDDEAETFESADGKKTTTRHRQAQKHDDIIETTAAATTTPRTEIPSDEEEANHTTTRTAPIYDAEEKTIVFAPVAIANHLPPDPGDWMARILCPYCDEYTYPDQGDDDEDDLRYAQDEKGFPDLESFQEHLEWYHSPLTVPVPVPSAILPTGISKAVSSSCVVM